MPNRLAGAAIRTQGAPKVLGYDRSKNGSIADIFATSGTVSVDEWVNFDLDYNEAAAKGAFVAYDGTNWKLMAFTLSGTTLTVGTAVTISGVVANGSPVVCVLSSTKLAVAFDGGTTLEMRYYTMSGTTLTSTASDGSVSKGSGEAGISLVRYDDNRVIAFYSNSSVFPSVIGYTFGASTITVDASATVITSGSTSADNKAIRDIGGNKYICSYRAGTNAQYFAIISATSSTTSVSTAHTQLSDSSNTSNNVLANDKAAIFLSSAAATGGMSIARLNSGTVAASYTSTGNSTSGYLRQAGPPLTTSVWSDLRGVVLGNVDGDGNQWFGATIRPYSSTDTTANIYACFFAINGNSGNPQDSFTQTIKLLTSSATNRQYNAAKIFTVNSTKFILVYLDATGADYKYMVCNL